MTKTVEESKIVRIIFIALLLDLLSFTIILPLFPRLLEFYKSTDTSKDSLLSYFAHCLDEYKQLTGMVSNKRWDTVMLGGFIGSLFSFLQFIVSPILGHASDRFGRRAVLLCTMIGNIVSTCLWCFANTFSWFLTARIIGGLSEGNVQLSIAMISDVTSKERRSKHMALVGIAFAIAFTAGPPLGAWLASIDLTQQAWALPGMYPYSMAALVALLLLLIETIYLFTQLPETSSQPAPSSDSNKSKKNKPSPTATTTKADPGLSQKQNDNLWNLGLVQCMFTFLFSGMEFTLVFLTYDVLSYSHLQQGKLLGFMGIASAMIQGGYVRRKRQQEKTLAVQGMILGTFGLASLALVGLQLGALATSVCLYCGVLCLAFTSGTVVNSLTSLASLQSQQDQGKHLGLFRSFGQLGRALGPLSACTVYWILGPVWTYGIGAMCLSLLAINSVVSLPSSRQIKTD
ncbi:MFS general substrate transporter [Hesseltinella vesiculosa]|uniref:MFS general substrate transporter n=1 Tax=Hesseltinella vesiculosa TaxID=101127 RepID=A0A1X2GAN4_9FUNG|nr:MFS general substrate transporter [Hesseltinella vesiculosa]